MRTLKATEHGHGWCKVSVQMRLQRRSNGILSLPSIYLSQRHHYTFQFVIIINFGCLVGIIAAAVGVVFDINKISKYQRTTLFQFAMLTYDWSLGIENHSKSVI